MNNIKNFNTYFFFGVLFAVTVAVFLLLKPFISAIFVAALFAVMFFKPHNFFLKIFKGRAVLSAILSCLLVTFTIILPFSIVAGLMGNEIGKVVHNVTNGNAENQKSIKTFINSIYEVEVFHVSLSQIRSSVSDEEVTNLVKNIVDKSLTFFQKTYQSVIGSIIWTFVMFFTLFYFFLDGKRFVRKIIQLSPMKDEHEKLLINKFVSMVRATLKGTLIIGIIQGLIGGFSFMIAGISSPVIWAVIMILISVIPATGASLVMIPAGIVMFILGNTWQGVFLLIVGVLVSVVDNFLRPKLVGDDTQMHGLLVFFATLGGLSVFGLIGFIVGPIIMALAIALWEIYATEFKNDLDDYNNGCSC